MQNILHPPKLKHGDTVAIIAPASVPDCDNVERAVAEFEKVGLHTKTYRDFYKPFGYLSGDDNARAKEINSAFNDSEINGIFCARGGYGTPRILDRIDYAAFQNQPKVFVGYSDITALHLAIQKETGVVTYHGPHPNDGPGVPESWDVDSARSFWNNIAEPALYCKTKNAVLTNSTCDPNELLPKHLSTNTKALVHGEATGILTGGNLAMLCALVGTPYAMNPIDRILFLEDVGEQPYQIDRMLTQLRLAGLLDKVAGIILGQFTNCEAAKDSNSLVLQEIFEAFLGNLGVPILQNYPAGHAVPNLTLPLGAKVTLSVPRNADASLTIQPPRP